MQIDVKWFRKDIISGTVDKVGDTFTALFFGRETSFRATEVNGDMIMAVVDPSDQ